VVVGASLSVVYIRVRNVKAVLIDVVVPAAYRECHWDGWHLGNPSAVDQGVVDGRLVVSWTAPWSLGPVASVGSCWLAADKTNFHATHAFHVIYQ
jgi:hypothetical protein